MGERQYSEQMYRGIALVIGNEFFDKKPGQDNIDRNGCLKDIVIMKKIFEKLDFFVMCYKDLTAAKMMEKIKNASTDPRNKECGSFVMVLSTHGGETFDKKANVWRHEVMGADRINVRVEDILQMFDIKKTSTDLDGKPKIFFIQACRSKDLPQPALIGHDEDKGITAMLPEQANSAYEQELPPEFDNDAFTSDCDKLYEGWVTDPECWTPMQGKSPGTQESGMDAEGDTRGKADSNELPPEPVEILSIKCPEDCLIYYPVMSGKAAFRYPNGSLMMLCLKDQFPKLLRGCSLNDYLTFVNRAMAERIIKDKEEEFKVTASVLHRMTKNVNFEPKSPNSPMAKAKKMVN